MYNHSNLQDYQCCIGFGWKLLCFLGACDDQMDTPGLLKPIE